MPRPQASKRKIPELNPLIRAFLLVTGSNFGQRQGSSTVTINVTSAYVIAWCSDAILAILPRNVSAGPVVVKVDGKTSNVGTAQVYTIRRW